MKSKTSCFNRTIFKKNITHYWPIWVLHLLFLLFAMPFSLWQYTTSPWFVEERVAGSGIVFDAVRVVLEIQIEPFFSFFFAAVMALAVFSYLYSGKNANMIHALPVNRLELFVTNYLSGLAFLLIPQIIAFVVTVLVCLGIQITDIQYLFIGLLIQAGISFFAYSLAVFVAMFTGQVLAMPIYYGIVNFLYVGCLYMISRVIELLGYGISNAWSPGKSCALSPLYYLGNNLRTRLLYADRGYDTKGIEIIGGNLAGIYAAAGVVLVAVAYQLYKRRQLETAGDWISIGIVKPVFRWGVALCGGLVLAVGFTELLSESGRVNIYLCMMISVVTAGFICFFAAEMLLEKSFRVFCKKRVLEWGGFAVAALLFITLFKVDAFGVERHVPAADEIEAAFVYMDYPIEVEQEDLETLLAIHRQAIADKETYLQLERENKGYYYTTFRYYLKDGSSLERRYPLPVTEEYVKDNTTPSGQIIAWESETENLKRKVLGMDYGNNKYISGMMDLYDDEMQRKDYSFDDEELEQIAAAIQKDIEEGNYTKYSIWSVYHDDIDQYYNNIYLDCYSNNVFNNMYDYYYSYNRYTRESGIVIEETVQWEKNITFGPECTNLVNTLKELGIVDDTWKLWTQSEYEQYRAQEDAAAT